MELGKFLLQEKVITGEQLQKALDHQKENPKACIGEVLIKLGFINVKTIVKTLTKQKPLLDKQKASAEEAPPEPGKLLKPEEIIVSFAQKYGASQALIRPISTHFPSLEQRVAVE